MMNHHISDGALHRTTKNAYSARFSMQSEQAFKNANTSKRQRPHQTSKLIKQIGGMAMVDYLALALTEQIAKNPILAPVYGDINKRILVQVERELLMYAFADVQDPKNLILIRHCELGLMIQTSYFDSLLVDHLQVLYDNIKNEVVLLNCANRFAELRPKLDAAFIQLRISMLRKKKYSPTLLPIIEEPVSGRQKNADTRSRASFSPMRFLRRQKSANAKAA